LTSTFLEIQVFRLCEEDPSVKEKGVDRGRKGTYKFRSIYKKKHIYI